MEPDEKKCPFCAEIIKAEAIKCKYCWSMLEPEDEQEPEPSQEPEIASKEATSSLGKPEEDTVEEKKAAVLAALATDSEEQPNARGNRLKVVAWAIGGAVGITIVVLLGVYGLKALVVLSYVVLALFGVGLLVLLVWASTQGSSSSVSGTRSTSVSGCKYCGTQLSGQALVEHIHAEHEEQYQRDLSKPISTGGVSSTSFYSSPSFYSSKPQRVCPTCGSTRVERFSRTWKVTKVATVGVFGLGNVHKIFKCKDCGYKW